MKEKWSLKGVDWGRLLIDTNGLPALRYAPAPKSRVLPCTHVISNAAVKCIVHGDGRIFPYLFPGPVVGLCGAELDGPGAAALLIREGGRIRSVVGPDHPRADHSDVVTGRLVLSPFAASMEFAQSELAIARRVALPIAGHPAIVVIHRVYNGGAGVRWLTLFDCWSLAPQVVAPGKPRTSSLTQRISKVFARTPEGNSYFLDQTKGNTKRVEARFALDPEMAQKVLADASGWEVPPIQFAPLTRNVRFHVAAPEDVAAVALEDFPWRVAPATARYLVCETRFEIPPGQSLHAASVVWFGPWGDAKESIRQFLPANHFEQNEAVLWRKRVKPGLVVRKQKNPALDAFEGMWYGGGCLGAVQYSPRGGYFAPTLGHDTFKRGMVHDSGYFGAVAEVLSWTDPEMAMAVLESSVPRLERSLRNQSQNAPFEADEAIWNLIAVATHFGLHGLALGETLGTSLPLVMEDLAAFVKRDDIYGSGDLLTTRWCDPEAQRAHALSRVPEREAGRLESVTSTAVLVRGCEVFAAVFKHWLPGAAQELLAVAERHRTALEALARQGDLEPWLLQGTVVPDPAATIDHLAALLWMGLPGPLEDAIYAELNRARKQDRGPSRLWAPRLLAVDSRRTNRAQEHYLAHVRLLQRGKAPCPDWHALLDPLGRRTHLEASRGTTIWPGRLDAVSTVLHYLAFFGIEVSSQGLVCRAPHGLDVARLDLPVLDVRASERSFAGEWRGQGESRELSIWPVDGETPHRVDMHKGEPWSVSRQ